MNSAVRPGVGAAVLLALAVPALAQVGGSALSGIVSDESGGAVPGATVQIRNIDTGVRRELVTGGASCAWCSPTAARPW